MKFKSTWLMLAALGAVAAYFYLVDQPRQQRSDEAKEAEGLVLPGFDPEAVTGLELAGRRGRARLERGEGGRWRGLEPWADRADDGQVQGLLAGLKSLKSTKEVAGPDADLAAFGLADPEAAVRLTGPGLALAVGDLTPAGDGRYLRAGGGPVRVAP
ncbi:MAG: DUF4340 domain-containing protein, partial [Deferrisomatales bacterium]